jgi:hypothetical protein
MSDCGIQDLEGVAQFLLYICTEVKLCRGPWARSALEAEGITREAVKEIASLREKSRKAEEENERLQDMLRRLGERFESKLGMLFDAQHRRTCKEILDHFRAHKLTYTLLTEYLEIVPRPEAK